MYMPRSGNRNIRWSRMKSVVTALGVAALCGAASVHDAHAQNFGYYGGTFNTDSYLFGQAFAQMDPYYQQNFQYYDGSYAVGLSNQYYNNFFGINAFPGGFPGLLTAIDQAGQNAIYQSNPRNFYPQWTCQFTSMGRAIPGFTVGGC